MPHQGEKTGNGKLLEVLFVEITFVPFDEVANYFHICQPALRAGIYKKESCKL